MQFLKAHTVFVISAAFAVLSMAFVLPDEQYLSYVDINTIASLSCVVVFFMSKFLFRRVELKDADVADTHLLKLSKRRIVLYLLLVVVALLGVFRVIASPFPRPS